MVHLPQNPILPSPRGQLLRPWPNRPHTAQDCPSQLQATADEQRLASSDSWLRAPSPPPPPATKHVPNWRTGLTVTVDHVFLHSKRVSALKRRGEMNAAKIKNLEKTVQQGGNRNGENLMPVVIASHANLIINNQHNVSGRAERKQAEARNTCTHCDARAAARLRSTRQPSTSIAYEAGKLAGKYTLAPTSRTRARSNTDTHSRTHTHKQTQNKQTIKQVNTYIIK